MRNKDLRLLDIFNVDDTINLRLVFSILQGEIWREGKISYYIYSREKGQHHLPHIHISVGYDFSASYSIIDAKPLTNKLPGKYDKIVRKKISNNKEFLLSCWNAMSDGLQVDIDYALGEKKVVNEKCARGINDKRIFRDINSIAKSAD